MAVKPRPINLKLSSIKPKKVTPAKLSVARTVDTSGDTIPETVIDQTLYQELSTMELIRVTRSGSVMSPTSGYIPAADTSSVIDDVKAQSVASLQSTGEDYSARFPITIDDHLPVPVEPVTPTPPGPTPPPKPTYPGITSDSIYIGTDANNLGDLIIELKNVPEGRKVEVEILTFGTVISDTIYT